MYIEPTITWVPSGFSGYIWLDTKIVFKKLNSENDRLLSLVRPIGINCRTMSDSRHLSTLLNGAWKRIYSNCRTVLRYNYDRTRPDLISSSFSLFTRIVTM